LRLRGGSFSRLRSARDGALRRAEGREKEEGRKKASGSSRGGARV